MKNKLHTKGQAPTIPSRAGSCVTLWQLIKENLKG